MVGQDADSVQGGSSVEGFIGRGLAVEMRADGHVIRADEPASVGGGGSGPDPFGLLLASLGSCVLMTMRMYAMRKGFGLDGARVRLTPTRALGRPLEAVRIEVWLDGALSAEERARVLEIAGRCPVHRTLEHGVRIEVVDGSRG